jgi:periplasmic protein TonB
MDLQKELLESGKGPKKRGGWKASATSIALHGLLVAGIVYAGQTVTHKVDAEKPMAAFITQGAAPPPPPPPPPPARSSGAPQSRPRVQPQPTPVIPNPLTPPVEIPKELPKVEVPVSQDLPVADTPLPESTGLSEGPGDALAGVVGGVEGGVAGGVVGGTVGGEVGGELGGVKGGQVGGTGTGTEGSGTGGVEAPVAPAPAPPPPAGPLRVGGDVKAPVIVNRADPDYTESARKARIAGIVIVEAIIDKQGNVDEVKIIKGLPMGLADEAVKAVRKWKFKPGTHNGQPVATIFNLTVNFRLDG